MNSSYKRFTIGFYNLENLFDIENDPFTNDDDFTPYSVKGWSAKRYENKLRKLGSVIAKIGEPATKSSPSILGLAEIENKTVLTDLLQSKHLVDKKYKYIHYDSQDERGIDVALIYNSDDFKVKQSQTFSLFLQDTSGQRDYTRDILVVQGLLNNESLHVIVNHWPSRRNGGQNTEDKRLVAAAKVNTIIAGIKKQDPNAKIIVMGDFNDNPNNSSLLAIESKSELFNPFKTVWSKDKGSLSYDFEWNLFDQILFSTNFFDSEHSKLSFDRSDIFKPTFLTQYEGKYKGQPFRTYVGKKYKGGYSDHFPIYMILKSATPFID